MAGVEVRERLKAYVDGNISAPEAEDWLEDAAWDDGLDGSEQRVATDALRLLAEHSNGDWSDAELKEKIGALYRTYWFEQAPKTAWGATGSGVILEDHRSLASAGRRHAAESA